MRKKASTVAMMVGAVVAAASVDAGPLPGFALKAQTEHFSFYSRSNHKIDAEKSERYLAQVQSLLGQRVSGRAEYYRYENPQEVAAGTGTYAEGVTFARAGQIHSTQEFHAHEIVHLVAGQMGNPGAFFQEGLAVALGNGGKWQGKDVNKLAKDAARARSLSAFISGFARLDANAAYPVAGSFVATLIQQHGIAKVSEFFRACSGDNTAAAFARTFGRTLDEAGTAWTATL
jgi:hypothetical protein